MSRETITLYRCDSCYKVLSDAVTRTPHLSLCIGGRSGYVTPVENEDTWEYGRFLEPGIRQFCDTSCLAAWFSGELGLDKVKEESIEVD